MNPLRSTTTPRFWKMFADLPAEIKILAIEKYELFKVNPNHSSLGFEAKGKAWRLDDVIERLPIDPKITYLGFGLDRTRLTTKFSIE